MCVGFCVLIRVRKPQGWGSIQGLVGKEKKLFIPLNFFQVYGVGVSALARYLKGEHKKIYFNF